MSALKTNGALISIGGAKLRTIGLSPQRLSMQSEARFPAHAVRGGLLYQKTGIDEESLTIEATTHPHVTGGLDAVEILKMHFENQSMVHLIRLSLNYKGISSGIFVIKALEIDEEKLHPFDGIGRKIDVAMTLLKQPVETIANGGIAR